MSQGNDYLWDKSGPPDPEVQKLEALLAEFRYQPMSLRLGSDLDSSSAAKARVLLAAFLRPRTAVLTAAAVLILAIGFHVATRFHWRSGEAWTMAAISGVPRVDGSPFQKNAQLAVGQVLDTDSASRALVHIGRIGYMEVEPNSRVRLLATRTKHHRVDLEYGTVSAHTWAPPFSFAISTASSEAFDLGCAFTLQVDERGYGILRVTSGWVALELDDAQTLIPAGAEAATRPQLGPGTPYYSDAPPALKQALDSLETSPPDSDARSRALDVIVANARPRDALTLLALMKKSTRAERERLLDRLSQYIPIPAGYTRADVLELRMAAMDQYWRALGLGNAKSWIMNWRDILAH